MAWGDHTEELRSLPEAGTVPIEHLPFAFVAESDDRMLGFATVLRGPPGQAELEDLFIVPERWRRGIGRLLLAEAERRAQALGARSLHVVAGGRARTFYQACGFEVVGTAATLFEPAAAMEKLLGGG
ncbi:MAG TPA: GNAT family N-acetyltransferase [Caulobacteraceae bacterium]